MTDHIPARVVALAAQIGDEPIAWKEHDDGSIVIVFCNKGKRTFDKTFEIEIPADVDSVGADGHPPIPIVDVKRKSGGLSPSKPKRKEKSLATPGS